MKLNVLVGSGVQKYLACKFSSCIRPKELAASCCWRRSHHQLVTDESHRRRISHFSATISASQTPSSSIWPCIAVIPSSVVSLEAAKLYRFFSSSATGANKGNVTAATTNSDDAKTQGAEMYRRYLAIQDEIQQLVKEAERQKSEKMFEAWKQAAEANGNTNSGGDTDQNMKKANDRMTGVAVVRTLAKETKAPKAASRVEQLKQQAAELLQTAADSFQHPPAMVQRGNDALENDDTSTAMQYYRRAGELGSAEAWFNVGHCLWVGVDDPGNKNSNALDAFRKAAELGDGDAQYFLGVDLLASEDDTSNEKLRKGLEWIQSAADLGHGGALYYLALFYRNGHNILGVEPCSSQEFTERLDTAVEYDSNGDSYFLRGSCYLTGDAFEKSPQKALVDLLKASELGQSDAAISAGAIFYNGIQGEIPQDRVRAFELYQRAGELGNLEGWRNVVDCYLNGHGVPQSKSIAMYIAETMLKPKEEESKDSAV